MSIIFKRSRAIYVSPGRKSPASPSVADTSWEMIIFSFKSIFSITTTAVRSLVKDASGHILKLPDLKKENYRRVIGRLRLRQKVPGQALSNSLPALSSNYFPSWRVWSFPAHFPWRVFLLSVRPERTRLITIAEVKTKSVKKIIFHFIPLEADRDHLNPTCVFVVLT